MKNKQLIIFISALICVGIVLRILLQGDVFRTTTNPTSSPLPTITESATRQFEIISYNGVNGQSGLSLLKVKYPDVQTQQSNFGEYVNSINGIVGGTNNKYWLFYVNGEMATVGADAYITKDSDVIEWRFE